MCVNDMMSLGARQPSGMADDAMPLLNTILASPCPSGAPSLPQVPRATATCTSYSSGPKPEDPSCLPGWGPCLPAGVVLLPFPTLKKCYSSHLSLYEFPLPHLLQTFPAHYWTVNSSTKDFHLCSASYCDIAQISYLQ